MAFSGNIEYVGPAGSNGIGIWTYSTTDTAFTTMNTGYFNDLSSVLENNSIILCKNSNGTLFLKVTSATGAAVVTVQSMDGYAAGGELATNLKAFVVTTPGGATADTNLIVGGSFIVLDVLVQLNAAGTTGDTIVVKTGSNVVSNVFDIASSADKALLRATSIDNAFALTEEGITVTQVDGGGSDSPSCTVTILGYSSI
jgi:hypothetical protein